MNQNLNAIDAVITWVDGAEENYLRKIEQWSGQKVHKPTPHFQAGELQWCLKSIFKFAPFIQTIFIVTDNQQPDLKEFTAAEMSKIRVIDHKQIFEGFEHVLPTFNIFAIESMLYRIPGLSEQFISFNDDFFLTKLSKPTDWFLGQKPVLRGKWQKNTDRIWYKKLLSLMGAKPKRMGFQRGQSESAAFVGFDNEFLRFFHTPRPLLVSEYEYLYATYPELLPHQLQNRFRQAGQYNMFAMVWHSLIKKEKAIVKNDAAVIELHNPHKQHLIASLEKIDFAFQEPNIRSLNVQSLEEVPPKSQEKILKKLAKYLN